MSSLPIEPMLRATYEAAQEHTRRLEAGQFTGTATRDQVEAARADEQRLEAALAALQGRLSLPSSSPETIVHMPSSSSPGVTYRVVVSPEGDTCECPGFTYRRECKHIARARALVEDPCRMLARSIIETWNGSGERGIDAWWRDLTLVEQALDYARSEIDGEGKPGDPVGAELVDFIRQAERCAVRVRARASAIYRSAEASLAQDAERRVAG